MTQFTDIPKDYFAIELFGDATPLNDDEIRSLRSKTTIPDHVLKLSMERSESDIILQAYQARCSDCLKIAPMAMIDTAPGEEAWRIHCVSCGYCVAEEGLSFHSKTVSPDY